MSASTATPLWGRFETSFIAGAATSPDVEVVVEFSGPDSRRRKVRAFWFGSREWRVRFSPDAVGAWSFRTRTNPRVPGLHAQTGTFRCSATTAPKNIFEAHGPIRVKPGARHLTHVDGTPFFWLGDTVWNGPMMSRTAADWDRFLSDRVTKHFNAIQFVMTHWRAGPMNSESETTFTGRDPIWINPHWFEKMDARFDAMAAAGFLAVPVLIWTLGKDAINPSTLPEKEIIKLCRYMVARYGAHPVTWILNGDGRYFGADVDKWKRIGRAVFDLGPHAPVMQHPAGMQWPHDAFADEPWIDLLGYQSGHGDDAETLQWIHSGPPSRNWKRGPARPSINVEPPYEDHISYQSHERHSPFTVRRACWWSVLNAPPAGLTYGAHGVWGWEEKAQPPADHFYTGVAQPWHVAMKLNGSAQMRHLADFFRGIDFWTLRPDASLVKSAPRSPQRPGQLHLVFSRNLDGEIRLFVNGNERARGFVVGDFSTWADGVMLSIGNESTGDYGWRGTLHRIALYDRALTGPEIQAGNEARKLHRSDPIAAWTFNAGRGTTIRDDARRGLPHPLTLMDARDARWTRSGLLLDGEAQLRGAGPADKIIRAARAAQAITIEAVLTPATLDHRAGGRIVSLEVDRWNRNLAFSQVAAAFTGNCRTAATPNNAEPTLATRGAETAFTFIAAARNRAGTRAVFYLPVGGPLHVQPGVLQHGLRAEWFDPRTGRSREARAAGRGRFRAPDEQDWVLHLRPKSEP